MKTEIPMKKIVLYLILFTVSILFLSGCKSEENKKYQYAEVYLNCENYSEVENDPGNCLVISGTTEGLRIRPGMVLTKEYVTDLMSDLGWKKEGQSSRYADSNGISFKVEIYKFKREIE